MEILFLAKKTHFEELPQIVKDTLSARKLVEVARCYVQNDPIEVTPDGYFRYFK